MKIALIGFGDISEKHISVFREFNCEIDGVFVQNPEAYVEKRKKFGISKFYKTLDEIKNSNCDFISIMTSAENNCSTLKQVIPFKKPILIEKPVGFSINEIDEVISLNKKFNVPIMVAQNRRFYSIFHKALEFLKSKNIHIDSIHIEAPERFSDINKPKFSENIQKHWMFVNSIHCIDLLRFFSGDIESITTFSEPSKYVFNAIGRSTKNIKFTYNSNWKSPGNWSITIYSDEYKIIFNPLENGKIISFGNEEIILPSSQDIKFKPGFYLQLKYFLDYVVKNHEFPWPCSSLEDHRKSLKLIEEIFISKEKN